MIVEDELIVAEEMRVRLQAAGHDVCAIIDSGERAVEISLREKPHAVIIDILLKGRMDGIQAARKIARLVDPAIVLISGLAPGDGHEFEFLSKPLDDGVLEAWLDSHAVRKSAV